MDNATLVKLVALDFIEFYIISNDDLSLGLINRYRGDSLMTIPFNLSQLPLTARNRQGQGVPLMLSGIGAICYLSSNRAR